MFQRKTLNRMSPKTRKLAQQANEAEKLWRNLKRQVEIMRELEFEHDAFEAETKHLRNELKATKDPDGETWKKESAIAKVTSKIF